jgi:hypothetical protein
MEGGRREGCNTLIFPMSISWGGRHAYKPHSIDGRHKAEAQRFNCEKVTVQHVWRQT